ncbi:alpha/beta hydrolase [Mycobacterium sp. CPCC 205372]|uniref:Alpha/beta hydrolase n=1 Tax=Mycobacterium hippophais TaxID=3016340 RepID=A0ABT4PXY2_9MYCO|nr:alpha/beta hydrolase [Mycobacterium hippophais]MCZ8381416.1 alpha/beta hydrolase [Mycobacterium hippophais]
MDHRDYARFLPAEFRPEPMTAPTPTWWPWRGRIVHIARAAAPGAAVRVLVIHGGGGWSGALWPLAALAARHGVEVLAPDLPLYGDTVEPRPGDVRYPDWVDLLCHLVRAERARDDRPLVVFGASMGGLLGYEVAARTRDVAHVVATCLIDPTDPAVRRAVPRHAWTGPAAPAVLRTIDPLCGRVRVPIRWLVDMGSMSRDPALSRLCARDPRGGGVRVPLGFLSSWLDFRHTAPETFDAAPVTLVHPDADRWTPPRLSIDFFDRLPGPKSLTLLQECGHYPVEQPGLGRLQEVLLAVRDQLTPA